MKSREKPLRWYRRWTKEELFVLRSYYGILPVEEIAKILNRTVTAIYMKAYRLKLKSDIPRGRKPFLLNSQNRKVLGKV